ncbi:rRNA methyltransferase, partial [Streptomyces sp. SID4956]|nr:rRNA methyltransferase [Streptomyces sp. SID4956]
MTDPAHEPSATSENPVDPVAVWRRTAPDAVLLDGFHALKHAVRFGAEVLVAFTADRAAALALADELAADVRDTLAALLTEVPHATYASLVPRPHPTAV